MSKEKLGTVRMRALLRKYMQKFPEASGTKNLLDVFQSITGLGYNFKVVIALNIYYTNPIR